MDSHGAGRSQRTAAYMALRAGARVTCDADSDPFATVDCAARRVTSGLSAGASVRGYTIAGGGRGMSAVARTALKRRGGKITSGIEQVVACARA
jgi:hypothetical protein